MNILKLCNSIILTIILIYSPILLSDVSSKNEAEKLLNVIGLEKAIDQTIHEMLEIQIQQKPTLAQHKNVLMRFLKKHMNYKSLKPELIKVYSSAFTAKELREINEFYNTETGKKAIRLMPEFIVKGRNLGAKQVQDNITELQEMIRAEIEHKKQSRQDPDPCGKLRNNSDIKKKINCTDKQIATLKKRLTLLKERNCVNGDGPKRICDKPRTKLLTSRTTDKIYADYLSKWKAQVHLFGNIKYPVEAWRSKLSGSVILLAKINADGSLVSTEIRKSSGYSIIDKAAVDAVKIAAPYDPFPEIMQRKVDAVDIIQTFRYGK